MAVTFNAKDDCYFGLSTDTKPSNVDPSQKFYEYDTKNIYIYNGSAWVLM